MFSLAKENSVSMATWNPLLLAIAHKKLDVVRYFI